MSPSDPGSPLPCRKCGNPSSHQVNSDRLCCHCFVAAGHSPSDWHPECMAASWDIPRLAYEYRQAGRFPFDAKQITLSNAIVAELDRRQQELDELRALAPVVVEGGR